MSDSKKDTEAAPKKRTRVKIIETVKADSSEPTPKEPVQKQTATEAPPQVEASTSQNNSAEDKKEAPKENPDRKSVV